MEKELIKFLQQVAVAVSSVLEFDVTITDSNYRRVAGTGKYKELIGTSVPSNSSFGFTLQTKKPKVTFDVQNDPVCRECEYRKGCRETCHICYPLICEQEIVGSLAMLGFSDAQQTRLKREFKKYFSFLKAMGELVVYAVQSFQALKETKEAKDQIRGIINALNEGIIAINQEGEIISCNQAASELLGFTHFKLAGKNIADISPDEPMLKVLKSGKTIQNYEVDNKKKGLAYISTARPLLSGKKIVGAVGLLQDIKVIHNIAYNYSAAHPDRPIDYILGEHPQIVKVKELALRAARGEANILITGESGTGKELFARAIHYHSKRQANPFIAVNCAALPKDLLESELFGFEEGSFTGAKKGGKPGKFKLADKGTLFLDEIADCSLSLQAKLLRVLDRGELQKIGSSKINKVDVRVLTATNKNLESMVESGEFREDLFFRLNVVPLWIPPLRERNSDIPLIFNYFLQKYRDETSIIPQLSATVLKAICSYHWPGNVRELENTVQYIYSVCSENEIKLNHLPQRILKEITTEKKINQNPGKNSGISTIAEMEKDMILRGLKKFGSSNEGKELLASQLGISRSTLYRKINKYKLRLPLEN